MCHQQTKNKASIIPYQQHGKEHWGKIQRVEILEKRLRHGTKQEKRRESDETLQFGSKEKR